MDSSTPAPDPAIGEAAKTNSEIAGRQQDLAEKAYADQTKIYEQFAPMLQEQLKLAATEQQKSIDRGDAQWASYQTNFAPLEAQAAKDAQEFDTPARREQAAGDAVGATSTAFDVARAGTRRALADAGVMAGSDRATTLDAQSRIEQAKASSLAANNARRATETQGLALVDNAARLGRNLPSTGIQTAALAGSQGGQVQGAYQGLQNGVTAPATNASLGLGQAVNSNNAAGQLYLNQFNGQNTANANKNGMIGDVLGAAASGVGAYLAFASTRRKKHMGRRVDGRKAAEAVEKSPSHRWRYRPGLGDGNTKERMGPTAEALAKVAPEVSDGQQVDGIAMLGLHHAAIGNVSKRLARMEKRLGLADARKD